MARLEALQVPAATQSHPKRGKLRNQQTITQTTDVSEGAPRAVELAPKIAANPLATETPVSEPVMKEPETPSAEPAQNAPTATLPTIEVALAPATGPKAEMAVVAKPTPLPDATAADAAPVAEPAVSAQKTPAAEVSPMLALRMPRTEPAAGMELDKSPPAGSSYPDTGMKPVDPPESKATGTGEGDSPIFVERKLGQSPARSEPPAPEALASVSPTAKAAAPAPAPIAPAAIPEPAWQEPTALLARLEKLSTHAAAAAWAAETSRLVRDLGAAVSSRSQERSALIERLDRSAAQGIALATKLSDRNLAQETARIANAIERRLSVWQHLVQIDDAAPGQLRTQPADGKTISLCLAKIDEMTRGSADGEDWRKYLLLDALQQWSAERKSSDDRVPRDLAQRLLKRLTQTPMQARQRQFLSSGPLATLQQELLRHAAQPVTAAALLEHMERYEQSGLTSDARLLATDCQYLALAADETHRQMAGDVESHYRNANVRFAVSAELLNRLIPKRQPEYAPVSDTILGHPVQGDSLLSSAVAVRLLPDPRRVLLALEIHGTIDSSTFSTAGPATFFNDSQSVYTARKPLQIDLRGIRLWPTQVDVENNTHLRHLATDFDGFPLVSNIVRGVARSQEEQSQPAAQEEVKQKVAAQAQDRIDRETSVQLARAARRLHEQVLGPMDGLAVEPTLIAAETTEQRFIMRVRLAGRDQLGSHTPRPQAPADSLASIQVHQSALNNVLDRLELDGRTFTMPELLRHVSERLSRPLPMPVNADHDDVEITFARENAVRLHCADGKIEVTLAVAELYKSPRRWNDFRVRAYYRPEVKGRSVEMVRDGVVQLIGTHLSTGGQIALRGVFSKAFAKTAPWSVIPEKLSNDPKLADLAITQFAVDDGWVGIALGPHHRTTLREVIFRR
ncbi:MAG: hypothetical protein ABSG68_15360 [Thermoguttaceae bacterium]